MSFGDGANPDKEDAVGEPPLHACIHHHRPVIGPGERDRAAREDFPRGRDEDPVYDLDLAGAGGVFGRGVLHGQRGVASAVEEEGEGVHAVILLRAGEAFRGRVQVASDDERERGGFADLFNDLRGFHAGLLGAGIEVRAEDADGLFARELDLAEGRPKARPRRGRRRRGRP